MSREEIDKPPAKPTGPKQEEVIPILHRLVSGTRAFAASCGVVLSKAAVVCDTLRVHVHKLWNCVHARMLHLLAVAAVIAPSESVTST